MLTVSARSSRRARPIVGARATVNVIAWVGVANVLLYVFLAGAARRMSTSDFGEFASVFSVVGVAGLALGGIQTAVAGHVSRLSPADRHSAIERALPAVVVCAAVGATMLLASPFLAAFLRTGSIVPLAAASAAIALLVPWSATLGAFQGAGEFDEFGRLTLIHAAFRLAALVPVLVNPSPTTALIGIAIAGVPPTVIGRARLGSRGSDWSASIGHGLAWLGARRFELITTFLVALVVGFPTLGDVLLARRALPADEAGLFSGVALLGRMELFLMMSVAAVFYPRFSAMTRRTASREAVKATILTALVTVPWVLVGWLSPVGLLSRAIGEEYAAAGTALGRYTAYVALHSLAAIVCYFNLRHAPRRALTTMLVAMLALQVAVPFVVGGSAAALATAYCFVGAAFLIASLVMWIGSTRAAPIDA